MHLAHLTLVTISQLYFNKIQLRSKDLNDVKIGVLGQAPAYPVPSLGFVFVSSSVG